MYLRLKTIGIDRNHKWLEDVLVLLVISNILAQSLVFLLLSSETVRRTRRLG